MKKQYMSYVKSGLLMIVCLASMRGAAQGFSPAAMEQLKAKRLWFQSQNAAGTAFDDVQNYSNVILGYDLHDGNYCRPQEGQKEATVGVSSEGFINLKNAYVWGAFNFSHENLTDAGYNASIADPFRGMPYYVADQHLSDWRNQYYDLSFRAATPLLGNHWTLGIGGNYVATLAAKQRDPRVDTRFYTLQLTPGVAYKVNDSHKLGVNFKYTSIKEDSRMSNVNVYVDQDYYTLFGLGTAIKGIGSGVTSNYIGDRFGGALQYNYSTSSFNLLFEGSYDVKAETVQHSYTTPRKIAGVKDKVAQASLTAVQEGRSYTNYAKLAYQNRHIDGIQYISQRDNSESQSGWMDMYSNIRSVYKTQAASLNYALSKNRGMEYAWKVELDVNYTKQDDKYLMPNSVQNAENLSFALGWKNNFVLGNSMNRRLLVDIHAAYNANLGGEYVYGGSHSDYLTVTGLQQGLTNYYTSDYYRIGGAVTYSQQVKENKRMNLFAKVAFDRVLTSDYDYDGRTYLSISLGCNF